MSLMLYRKVKKRNFPICVYFEFPMETGTGNRRKLVGELS